MRLYRFERLDHLLEMIRKGEVSFSHPSQWDDPYEICFLTAGHTVEHALVKGADGTYRGKAPRRADSSTAHITYTNPYGQFVFAQCFVSDMQDSERLWLAAHSDGRVRWSINAEPYLLALRNASKEKDVVLKGITYRPTDEVTRIHQEFVLQYLQPGADRSFEAWTRNVIGPFTTKRSEFRDEHEYRVIVIDKAHHARLRETRTPPPPPMPPRLGHTKVSVPLAALLIEVTLPPQLEDVKVKECTANLRTAGFLGPVSQSSLYTPPILGTRTENPIVEP